MMNRTLATPINFIRRIVDGQPYSPPPHPELPTGLPEDPPSLAVVYDECHRVVERQLHSLDAIRASAERSLSAGTVLILGVAVIPVKMGQDPVLWGASSLMVWCPYFLMALVAILTIMPAQISKTSGPAELRTLMGDPEPFTKRQFIGAMVQIHDDNEALLSRLGHRSKTAYVLLLVEIACICIVMVVRTSF